jgi:hypothetical protein
MNEWMNEWEYKATIQYGTYPEEHLVPSKYVGVLTACNQRREINYVQLRSDLHSILIHIN